MKSSASNVMKFALGLAISASVFACKQTPTETKTTAAPVAVDDKATIVFVNQDTLSEKYKYAVEMRKRLEEKSNQLKGEVGSRQQALQREYADAQRTASTMTQDQQKAFAEKFQKDQGSFQQFQQNASAEFQDLNAAELKKLYDRIVDFSKTYAKEKGYKMVLTYQNGNATMLYGDPSLDVTNDFMKKLNEAFDKEKK